MLDKELDFNKIPKSVLIASAKYIILTTYNYADLVSDIWDCFGTANLKLDAGEDLSSWKHAKKLVKLFKENDKQTIKTRLDEKIEEHQSKLERTMPIKNINTIEALIKRDNEKYDFENKIMKIGHIFENLRSTFCVEVKRCLQALDWYDSYNLWYVKTQDFGHEKTTTLFVTIDKVGLKETVNSKENSTDFCKLEETKI